MTKLYTVSIGYNYVIAVEDDEDPYDVAEDVLSDVKWDLDAYNADLFTTEMKTLPHGWDEDCYPYRSSGQEKTIKQILEGN